MRGGPPIPPPTHPGNISEVCQDSFPSGNESLMDPSSQFLRRGLPFLLILQETHLELSKIFCTRV
jgi:hypothetical protein